MFGCFYVHVFIIGVMIPSLSKHNQRQLPFEVTILLCTMQILGYIILRRMGECKITLTIIVFIIIVVIIIMVMVTTLLVITITITSSVYRLLFPRLPQVLLHLLFLVLPLLLPRGLLLPQVFLHLLYLLPLLPPLHFSTSYFDDDDFFYFITIYIFFFLS